MTVWEKLASEAENEVDRAKDIAALEGIKLKYLGRKGLLNQLIQSLPEDDLRQAGREIKKLKDQLEVGLSKQRLELLAKTETDFDLGIPGLRPPQGHLHLITQAIEEIEQIFQSLGFVRRRYPEVDLDWYAAEGLNIPPNHPARDDQETFYLTDKIVLTAHTSNGQLREMERVKTPPIKMINIGKTYRRQADVSHTPMFHQFEGLVIDKDINLTHLVGICTYFAKGYFGQARKIRLRPHHFQFTEPSFEVDITCDLCLGTGKIDGEKCRLCKSGWLELGGAGLVHPKVLANGGIDPNLYRGIAFGWGVERVLMMKSGLKVADLRQVYSQDFRFLSQF